jgi:hypothetical protein
VRPVASGIWFAAASTAVALVVVAVGSLVADIPDRDSVRAGSGDRARGPDRFVLGSCGLALPEPSPPGGRARDGDPDGRAARDGVRRAAPRAPLAPTLLTMVSVFVLTTLLEPVLFQLETKRAS